MKPIIKIENVSKQYRLGLTGTGTFSHDVNRWWHSIRGKEDPYLKIGETNDRSTKGESDYVWALRDINFEVMPGEVLGIIGKNGAGKSTLLKLLSRVTAPTTGSIKARGRIASLLEVGTGFHPELTGGENIFLNGAIMGMTKPEIRAKFDEIVDFAGCERYIDTPVKRYSSGMYVRLAFAVAAHLEPDILVVDEVLAVGDAEFQKKAIGKMKEVSTQGGRTVLFVSHNMASVKRLCNRGMLIENGICIYRGTAEEVINKYNKINSTDAVETILPNLGNKKDTEVYFTKIFFRNFKPVYSSDDNIAIEIHFHAKSKIKNLVLAIRVKTLDDIVVNSSYDSDMKANINLLEQYNKGSHVKYVQIPKLFFNKGTYKLDFVLFDPGKKRFDELLDVVIDIDNINSYQSRYYSNRAGLTSTPFLWT